MKWIIMQEDKSPCSSSISFKALPVGDQTSIISEGTFCRNSLSSPLSSTSRSLATATTPLTHPTSTTSKSSTPSSFFRHTVLPFVSRFPFQKRRLHFPNKENSDEEDVLFSPPPILLQSLSYIDDSKEKDIPTSETISEPLSSPLSLRSGQGSPARSTEESKSIVAEFKSVLAFKSKFKSSSKKKFSVNGVMAAYRSPSVKSISSSIFPPTPPLPNSSPPVVPAACATPYLDHTPLLSRSSSSSSTTSLPSSSSQSSSQNTPTNADSFLDVDIKENRLSSEEIEGDFSRFGDEDQTVTIENPRYYPLPYHSSNPSSAAFLPSTPSSIPLIDDSPNVDMTKRSYNVSQAASSSSSTFLTSTMNESSVLPSNFSSVPLSPPPFSSYSNAETPSLPHIRSMSTGVTGDVKLPVMKGRQGLDRSTSLKPTLQILPTPMSSSGNASSSLSASMLLSSEQKSSSLHKFRYTTLWNGAVSALKDNVAIKRRKKMGGFALLSSAGGTMDIFSGQDATNVLLNYLLEKKAEFTSSDVNRSKAVKLGQQLMNNGYYKPVKKSGSTRGRETMVFEDSASKFYLFCEKDAPPASASSSSSSSTTAAPSSQSGISTSEEDVGTSGFECRRNSMRHRKGRVRHPSDPGTPHSRSKNSMRKRRPNGSMLNISKLDIDDVENKNPDEITPVNSPTAKEVGGIVNPAFSTMSNASVPEEVKEIFGPLKLSMQDSIQRVSSTATRFSRSVFSTSSLRSDKPPQPQHQSQSQLGSFQLKSIHQDPPSHSFGLRSSFGKGAKATTENFRAPGRLRRVFSQSDLRGSTSPSKDEGPTLVSPAVESEILREAALSRLFSLVDLNILDDVISAVDQLVASDTNAVSEGLLLPREEDDDEGSHEILSRWDSQGSLFPHPQFGSPVKMADSDSVYHQWLVASSELLEALPPLSPQSQKQAGTFFNNVAFDVETLDERCLRLFQTTTDKVFAASASSSSSKKNILPILLPSSLTAVYTAISELLCLGREKDALLASQLLVLLIPSNRRIVLLRLLQFMNIAVFNSTIRLVIGKSNAAHVFESFAPVIFGKKFATNLPDWKSFLGHLVRHSEEVKEVPQEIKDAVEEKVNMISMRSSASNSTTAANQNLRRSSRFRKSAVQYCQTIDEETFEEQKVSKTNEALRGLYKSIKEDSTLNEETKNRYLQQMLISHPNLFVTQL